MKWDLAVKEQTRKERIEENRNFNYLKHLYSLPEFKIPDSRKGIKKNLFLEYISKISF